MKDSSLYLLYLLIFCVFISCADDTEVGYGLLGEEDLELEFRDDFLISIKHISPAPIEIENPSFHSLGTLNDERYGKMKASFYLRPILSSFNVPPEFGGGIFDSVVLTLAFDTTRTYGDPLNFHDIEVYALTESIDNLGDIFSNEEYMTEINPLGNADRLVPANVDSLPLVSEFGDTTFFNDVLSITLNRRFGARIFNDTTNNKTSAGFATLLDGFYVTSESNNSLLQIDLNSQASALIFHYRDTTGQARLYPYEFGRTRPANFSYENEGSVVGSLIDSSFASEFMFVQGHAGTIIELDISDIAKLNDPFVNFANLEVFAQQAGFIDTSDFDLPLALDLLKLSEEGEFVEIIDLSLGRSIGQISGFFDGDQEIDVEEKIVKYELNITTYVKEFFKGNEDGKIYLTIRNRVDNPNNVILYGPEHPTFPAKLNLTYTKI